MLIAAHQPNFMPWLGYFDKMNKADLFVSVDHVQYERQSYQSRARIKTGEGARWVTVPVVQESRDERIADKRIDNSRDGRFRWGRKMFLTLKYSYQAAGHFAAYEAPLADILNARWDKLSDLNHALIDFVRRALEIRTPMVRSTTLGVQGKKSDMVLNMCRALGATGYPSGAGASRGYLDQEAFRRAGVKVIWQEFQHPRYAQRPNEADFVERLSVLDLLFNAGPAAAELFHRRVESGALSERAA